MKKWDKGIIISWIVFIISVLAGAWWYVKKGLVESQITWTLVCLMLVQAESIYILLCRYNKKDTLKNDNWVAYKCGSVFLTFVGQLGIFLIGMMIKGMNIENIMEVLKILGIIALAIAIIAVYFGINYLVAKGVSK